ncbi:MAG: hypothetical protein DHS20C15_15920 [Planctomycetota bacterium]|nr:MAG: hypothetical protein DHS20C15_15920 [Planctomycetota bacterium]
MSPILLALVAANMLPFAQQSAALSPTTQARAISSDVRLVVRKSSADADAAPPGMVHIPGGRVVMGTEESLVKDLGSNNPQIMTLIAAELPRHEEEVESFYIDRTEVTNRQWKAFLDSTDREPGEELAKYYWVNGEIPDGQEDFPVSLVSFPDVQQFLQWSGKRLPNEAEWTRAARGDDDDRIYPWGPRWDRKKLRSADGAENKPAKVGSYPEGASPFGVLDMVGNVMEWVDSPFDPFEGFKPYNHRIGRKDIPLSPNFSRTNRILKGGSFLDTREGARIDGRRGVDPRDAYEVLGFRCARSMGNGVEAVMHAYDRLLPPRIRRNQLDMSDVFAKEITHYDPATDTIRGYQYLAFAPPAAQRLPNLARIRKDARENQLVLGMLTTSEPLIVEPTGLPPGEYLVTWKTEGESKEYRDKKRARKKDRSRKDDDKETPPAGSAADSSAAAGASSPWPGVNVNDIRDDVDYPQERNVYIFYNVNDAAVGWLISEPVTDEKREPIKATEANNGTEWTIEFSLNTGNREDPRFVIPLKLHGEGLGG